MNPARRRWVLPIASVILITVGYCLYRGTVMGFAVWHTTIALEELAAGNHTAAHDHLERAVRWDDGYATAQEFLARAADGSGDGRAARERLRNLVESGSATNTALDALGRSLEEAGEIERAREVFTELAARYPDDVSGVIGLARLGDTSALVRALGEITIPLVDVPIRGISLLHLDDGFGSQGYGTPACVRSLRNARSLGANTVSIRVPGREASVDSPTITFGQEPPGGETDVVVRRAIRDAHLLGFRVMLKPHIMLGRITDTEWRGSIAFEDSEELEVWWSAYRAFILHYAHLAAEEETEIYCIGVELRTMARDHGDRWHRLIRDVRALYPGRLTYAANWYEEYAEVPFWNALDLIGIQFFFPLSDEEEPTAEQIENALAGPLAGLGELAFLAGKPVLITEVGYKSTPSGLTEPWRWPRKGDAPDEAQQARAYREVFRALDGVDWCEGWVIWNWLTTPVPPEKFAHDFTPQGKSAESVLRDYWARE